MSESFSLRLPSIGYSIRTQEVGYVLMVPLSCGYTWVAMTIFPLVACKLIRLSSRMPQKYSGNNQHILRKIQQSHLPGCQECLNYQHIRSQPPHATYPKSTL
ncbi:hypothetical protein EVAR_29973_1 [Eumeta japonica]|uniref:Uncharacterized protein n=1 Tax=Eumeta variegata TaxID=151549 RepID=A0A4C1VH25_EUMVA|nr:hypothetical protein EVAR_29973_1 [Eumeta japonica]